MTKFDIAWNEYLEQCKETNTQPMNIDEFEDLYMEGKEIK